MKVIEYHPVYPYRDEPFSSDTIVLDIMTTGRFWRTSDISRFTLIRKEAGECGRFYGKCFVTENSGDEYELLRKLPEELRDIDTVITFNGHSFDLPYLKKKVMAYGLPDPFTGHTFRDLLIDYRPLKTFLGLPSCRLEDFYSFLANDADRTTDTGSAHGQADDQVEDAVKTLMILSLDAYLLLDTAEALHFCSACIRDGRLEYHLSSDRFFPRHYSVHEEPFHMITEENRIALSIASDKNLFRFYHSDIGNYVFLPHEGYAIHRSMASFIDSSRKEKAVRENCFHLIPYSDRLLTDDPQTIKLISSALQYLLQLPDRYKPSRY